MRRLVAIAQLVLAASCAVAHPPPAPAVVPAVVAAPVVTSVELASLDPSVDPCDDFYGFACGGWMRDNPTPEDRAQWGRGTVIGQRNLDRIRALLEAPPPTADGKKLGDHWATCMDEGKAESLAPLQRELAAIDAISTRDGLAKALAHLHALDDGVLFSIWVGPNEEDTTRELFHVGQSGLGLPDRDYYFGDRERATRETYLAHVGTMLGLVGRKDAKREAATIVALETKLAAAHSTRVALRDPQNRFHLVDRTWLREHAGGFAWETYFAALGVAPDRLDVAQPAFFTALGTLVTGTPIADLKTYLRWQLVASYASTLSAALVDASFAFRKTLSGAQTNAPRWKRCVWSADGALRDVLAKALLDTTLPVADRARADALMKTLLSSMHEDLETVAWLDAPTRAAAMEKLGAMRAKVALPEKPIDYAALVVGTDSYFENTARANAFYLARSLAKVGRPVDRDEWHTSAALGDCNFRWSGNEVTVPGGMLQPPLFGAPMTRAMEFGALGTYLGHEITHGFDDEGRKYDAAGNRRDWWSAESSERFTTRASCVREQYDAIVESNGEHPNGALTLGEDLADLGGIKLAWSAFQKRPPSTTRYDRPEEQQFFIGYGQWWCRNIRDRSLHTMLANDPHAPPHTRVNATLANTPEFARVFACKPGSKMVRAPRCELW